MTAATIDLSRLSQQELIAMVQKLQGEVRLKDEAVAAQARQVEKLTAETAAWRQAMIENLPAIQTAVREFDRSVGVYGDFLSLDILSQVRTLCKDLVRFSKDACQYRRQIFGRRSEALKPAPKAEEGKAALDEARRTFGNIENSMRQMRRQVQATIRAAEGLPADATLKRAAANIEKSMKMRPAALSPQKPAGRRVTHPDIPHKTHEARAGAHEKCRKCGSGKLEPIAEIKERLLTKHAALGARIEQIETRQDLMICRDCGHAHIVTTDDQPLPIVPNRSIAIAQMVDSAFELAQGTPLARSTDEMKEAGQLGNDTIPRNFRDFAEIYLKPLNDEFQKDLESRAVVCADETTFDNKEAQGGGHVSKKKDKAAGEPEKDSESTEAACENKTTSDKKEVRDGEQEAAKGDKAEEETRSSQCYLLAMTTPAEADNPIVHYSFLRTRSKASLRKLMDGLKCDVLVSDGYSAYQSMINEGFGRENRAQRQSCLTHFRRVVCQALGSELLRQQAEAMSDEELVKISTESLKKDDPDRVLLIVLAGIGEIYALEKRCARKEGESEADWLKRRETERKDMSADLMNDIDDLMRELSKGRLIQNKRGGGWRAASRVDRYAEPCRYYMNQRENLRVFLSDARVPPSSDIVEGRIRPLTVLRKNIYFMQTMRGMKAFAHALSVVQTGRLNDFDVRRWLLDYSRALYLHCVEEAWSQALYDGKDPNRRIMKYDMEELQKGFDFAAWLPARCADKYRRRHAAA